MPAAVLEASDLYRFYRNGDDETLALRGISLRVDAGEVLAVVGPSGSGKSTLLACLAGLDEPAGGSVSIGGVRISHRPERERARIRAARIGVLLQSRNLLPHLDIRDNILLVQRNGDRSRTRFSALELLDQVGLTERAHALPRHLSGGELARAGLAVAMANAPDVLLADEPSGELDGASEQQLLALLHQLAARQMGILMVTHSDEVTRTADRLITLTDGRICS
jgi:putative ABC transport system ATP-binding protein